MGAVWTEEQEEHLKKKFLLSYRETGNISESCRKAGIGSRNRVYEWQEEDEQFVRLFKEAKIQAVEKLEEVARKRAVRVSDTLLIFLLKAHKPDVYRERFQLQHADSEGNPLPVRAVEEFVVDALVGR